MPRLLTTIFLCLSLVSCSAHKQPQSNHDLTTQKPLNSVLPLAAVKGAGFAFAAFPGVLLASGVVGIAHFYWTVRKLRAENERLAQLNAANAHALYEQERMRERLKRKNKQQEKERQDSHDTMLARNESIDRLEILP